MKFEQKQISEQDVVLSFSGEDFPVCQTAAC